MAVRWVWEPVTDETLEPALVDQLDALAVQGELWGAGAVSISGTDDQGALVALTSMVLLDGAPVAVVLVRDLGAEWRSVWYRGVAYPATPQ